MDSDYDYLFKILLIGDSGVGKSCLLLKYLDDSFVDSYISTIGVDFRIKTTMCKNKTVKMQIWDTAGQERFRTITSSYYRGAHAVIIGFDLTDYTTFLNVKHWMDEIDRQGRATIKKIIVGTKCDLVSKRVVKQEDIDLLTAKLGLSYFETSSKTGAGIEKVFDGLCNDVVEFVEPNKTIKTSNSITKISNINPGPTTTQQYSCCYQ